MPSIRQGVAIQLSSLAETLVRFVAALLAMTTSVAQISAALRFCTIWRFECRRRPAIKHELRKAVAIRIRITSVYWKC